MRGNLRVRKYLSKEAIFKLSWRMDRYYPRRDASLCKDLGRGQTSACATHYKGSAWLECREQERRCLIWDWHHIVRRDHSIHPGGTHWTGRRCNLGFKWSLWSQGGKWIVAEQQKQREYLRGACGSSWGTPGTDEWHTEGGANRWCHGFKSRTLAHTAGHHHLLEWLPSCVDSQISALHHALKTG